MVEVCAAGRALGHRVTRGSTIRRLIDGVFTVVLLVIPILAAMPAQAYSSQQWALEYLKANAVWQITKGSGVTVAVIDTGVASIPDLHVNLTSGADFSTGTSSTGNGQTDVYGHGTAMAVVIAGSGFQFSGLAMAAKILPVRAETGGAGSPEVNAAAAVEYAVQQHVQVINISLGWLADDHSMSTAINDAIAANIVVVASTGDEGPAAVDYPAVYPGVVAVSAISQTGQLWGQSNIGSRVALAAPGVGIYTDDETGAPVSTDGTSASAAYVSAAAALVRSEHPSWTAGQVIRDLISTADPGPGQTAGQHNNQYGYGIVDPLKALQAAAPTDTTNPLLTSSDSTGSTSNTSVPTTTASGSHKSSNGLILGIATIVVLILVLLLLIVRLRVKPRG
jgi:subtilisin family serine protease